jgi:hypothetical protein
VTSCNIYAGHLRDGFITAVFSQGLILSYVPQSFLTYSSHYYLLYYIMRNNLIELLSKGKYVPVLNYTTRQLYAFFTSALDKGEWLVTRSDYIRPGTN